MSSTRSSAPAAAGPLSAERQPFPQSRKVHETGSRPDLRVPMREVQLSHGGHAVLYDTSGPYTDPSVAIDLRRGLPPLRAPWIEARADSEPCAARQIGRAHV